jgi:cysteinyl-tRNA synthetase
MELYFFNTLGRKKEKFVPIVPGKVGLYTCGPTVYDFAHLGNFRTFIFEDVLRRTLEYNGFEVKHVMNITDVGHLVSNADEGEDKIELGAKREGKTAWEIAAYYTEAFLRDSALLNIKRAHILPRATDHIKEQIELIQVLEKKGFTYRTSDGIYYDTSKFKDYWKLSGQRPEERLAGARVEINPEKKNPWDFALWKFSPKDKKRQMEWPSPWGIGFPGWHIECSAMSVKYLGQPFDIHTGGVDHIPIHHTNEIAQSEGAFNKKMVNYWLHGEFLMVEGKRMGKSEGNLIKLQDIIAKGFDPLAFRYLCLTSHYRSILNFTWKSLEAAQNSLNRLREHLSNLSDYKPSEINSEYKNRFLKAINDDLNTPEGLSVMWEMLRSKIPEGEKLATLLDFDKVLGLKLEIMKEGVPEEVKRLVDEREGLRKKRKWAEADKIRQKIAELGYLVEDTPKGPKVKKLA